jgi:hypothetical protein
MAEIAIGATRSRHRPWLVTRAAAIAADRTQLARTLLFTAAFGGYAAIGQTVVLGRHVLDPYSDAVARLAHAFFVFYGSPGKLTALGFVWPPLMTAVLLPFAAIRPLATSLTGMVVMSAFFGAYLLVSLDRLLAVLGLPAPVRLLFVVLFGCNPMIVYYASNGMSEVVYLAVLVAGVEGFLRWALDFEPKHLARAGTILALGVVTRYEVIFWVGVIAALIYLLPDAWWHGREAVEGSLIAFLAPTVYAVGVWALFNWIILGDPLYWVHAESDETFTHTVARLAPADAMRAVVSMNWRLYAPVVGILGALMIVGVFKRTLLTWGIAAMIAMNGLITFALLSLTGSSHVLQLRYNMRGMPFAVIGAGWLWHVVRASRPGRWLVVVGTTALLVASLPITASAMSHYPRQFTEQAFLRALTTGRSQEGTRSIGVPVAIGNQPEHDAADWIEQHVRGDHVILTDDAQSFHVILLTGHPGLFFDRIDYGDTRWHRVLEHPFGKVRYLLVARPRGGDLVTVRYPQAVAAGRPGWHKAFQNERWIVWRIDREPPT